MFLAGLISGSGGGGVGGGGDGGGGGCGVSADGTGVRVQELLDDVEDSNREAGAPPT